MSLRCGIFDWVEASGRAPAEVYEHKLELASAAERAGFHGIFFAEHHGTPLSIDGSPTALLSAVFQRTRHLRAGALTFCLPWYHPYRFYSEVCMLDQMSHGRLELGVGRGCVRPGHRPGAHLRLGQRERLGRWCHRRVVEATRRRRSRR